MLHLLTFQKPCFVITAIVEIVLPDTTRNVFSVVELSIVLATYFIKIYYYHAKEIFN